MADWAKYQWKENPRFSSGYVFEWYRDNDNYKYCGIVWFLWIALEAMRKHRHGSASY